MPLSLCGVTASHQSGLSYFYNTNNKRDDYSSKKVLLDLNSNISKAKNYTLSIDNTISIGEHFVEQTMKNITYVEYDGIKLRFKTPFSFVYQFEDGAFFYQIAELSIFGYGEDLIDMLNDFYENIVIDWKIYVKNDKERLNKKALILRKKLLELLEEC